MTQPQKIEVKTIEKPKTDWDEVARRQKRTQELLEQTREAQRRLEKVVDRVTQKSQ